MTEAEAWERFHATGDDQARTFLIEYYTPLVEDIMRSFRRVRRQDQGDLRGSGYLGLVRSVDQWDADRMPWLQFARFRIKAEMINHIRKSNWISKSLRTEARKIEQAEEALTAELHGRPPTDTELAGRLGLTDADELAELRSKLQAVEWSVASLDLAPEGGGGTWAEVVPDPTSDVEAEAERRAMAAALRSVLDRLPPRHRDVLESRYLRNEKMQDVAARYGLHPSRISQLEVAALEMARKLSFERPLEVH